jgi:hypothetical protein
MRRPALLLILVVTAMPSVPRTYAAASPGLRCVTAKMKAVSLAVRKTLLCHAKGVARGVSPSAACVSGVQGRLGTAFAHAETKGWCVSHGDGANIGQLVAALAATTAAALPTNATSEGRRCAAAKLRATAKEAGAVVACAARVAGNGSAADPACLTAAQQKQAAAFAAAEVRGQCATSADASAIAADVQGFEAAMATQMSPPPVSFSSDVQPIFDARCATAGCHVGPTPAQGLDLTTGQAWVQIVGRPSGEKLRLRRVQPGDPMRSYLYQKLVGAAGLAGVPMPNSGGALAAEQIQVIATWIAEGASAN